MDSNKYVYDVCLPVLGQPDYPLVLVTCENESMVAEVVRILLLQRDQKVSEICVKRRVSIS